jgi:hypothetical protein
MKSDMLSEMAYPNAVSCPTKRFSFGACLWRPACKAARLRAPLDPLPIATSAEARSPWPELVSPGRGNEPVAPPSSRSNRWALSYSC